MRLRPPALYRPRTAVAPTGPPDLRLANHAATTSGPLSPAHRGGTDRASGSAPRCSCGYDLRPSIARAPRWHRPGLRICASLFMRLRPPALYRPRTAVAPTGPPDLRLAVHAATTSGPLSPAHRGGTDRASGSA